MNLKIGENEVAAMLIEKATTKEQQQIGSGGGGGSSKGKPDRSLSLCCVYDNDCTSARDELEIYKIFSKLKLSRKELKKVQKLIVKSFLAATTSGRQEKRNK